jgi:hypothetical protein
MSHLLRLRTASTFPRCEAPGGAKVNENETRKFAANASGVRTSPVSHAMAPHQETPLPVPAPSAVFRKLPEGGVLFSTETEVYFGVGVVGAAIWELLPPVTKTVEEMVATLSAKYRDVSASQIRADCDRFLEELVSNGLVTHVQAPTPGNPKVP